MKKWLIVGNWTSTSDYVVCLANITSTTIAPPMCFQGSITGVYTRWTYWLTQVLLQLLCLVGWVCLINWIQSPATYSVFLCLTKMFSFGFLYVSLRKKKWKSHFAWLCVSLLSLCVTNFLTKLSPLVLHLPH